MSFNHQMLSTQNNWDVTTKSKQNEHPKSDTVQYCMEYIIHIQIKYVVEYNILLNSIHFKETSIPESTIRFNA